MGFLKMKKFLLFFLLICSIVFGISRLNKPQEKSLVVIMMGPPGAGKGTHAVDLSKKLEIPHISTGDLIRMNIQNQTDLGKKVKELIEKGQLAPDNLVLDLLFDHINKNSYTHGYILDGFPRTLPQAEALEQRLKKNSKIIVINLNTSDEFIAQRILGRLICKNCGASFHKTFLPPKTEDICDNCNNPLSQRKDDTEEIIKERLAIYHKETQPLIEYYKNKNFLFEIDSNKSKSEVFQNLINTIEEAR